MLKLSSENTNRLWEAAHNLSAPASTLPYPDTHAIATFCMILDCMAEVIKIEEELQTSSISGTSFS
jgi:hypothetical protein